MEVQVDFDGGQLPTRSHSDDAGFDLYTSKATLLRAGQHTDVPCGIRLALPWGTWGLIIGRSSTLRKRGIHVQPNVIDTGYRGPMFAGCWVPEWKGEPGGGDVLVGRGERVAQLVLLPNIAMLTRVIEVAELDDTERGSDGFGSTGR